MIKVTVTPDFFFCVRYEIQGLTVSSVECKELSLALAEVENKMRMDFAIHKGKIFTNGKPQ